jgi:hypothetical protein
MGAGAVLCHHCRDLPAIEAKRADPVSHDLSLGLDSMSWRSSASVAARSTFAAA